MYIKLRIFLKQLLYQKSIAWKLIETIQGIVFTIDYLRFYSFDRKNKKSSLKEINIEFANFCNLRCSACSLDHSKAKRLLNPETLSLFMEQFINDKRFRSVEIINLHNGGEVLLHPKLKEMLSLIKKYRDKSLIMGQKFPRVFILTNAMKLNPEISKILIESDIIDVIGFSLDGGTPQAFNKMRHRAIWSVVYDNIKHFEKSKLQAKKPIESYAISCIPEENELNIKWMHPEFQEILNLIDRYELRRLHNWAGEIEHFPLKFKKHKIGCTLLMQQMVLLPEGNVTLCCNDLNSLEVLGNIYKKNFYDIYKLKKRRMYLRKHIKAQNQDLKLCSGCETF